MNAMTQRLGRVLALDLGERRSGVAVCDHQRTMALPRPPLAGLSEQELLVRQILDFVSEEGVVELVVGLPRSLNGKESSRAGATRRFVADLTPQLEGINIHLEDERLSTVEAARVLHSAGLSAKQQKDVIDSAAAVIVLESWLACQ
jgi:putative Holliday junction resolvase